MATPSLMGLSAECRCMIYDHVFNDNKPLISLALETVCHNGFYHGKIKKIWYPDTYVSFLEIASSTVDHPLLAVSKQVRAEVLDRFPVKLVIDALSPRKYSVLEDFLFNRLPEHIRKAIRTIEIEEIFYLDTIILNKTTFPSLRTLQIFGLGCGICIYNAKCKDDFNDVMVGKHDAEIIQTLLQQSYDSCLYNIPYQYDEYDYPGDYEHCQVSDPHDVAIYNIEESTVVDRGFDLLCRSVVTVDSKEGELSGKLELIWNYDTKKIISRIDIDEEQRKKKADQCCGGAACNCYVPRASRRRRT